MLKKKQQNIETRYTRVVSQVFQIDTLTKQEYAITGKLPQLQEFNNVHRVEEKRCNCRLIGLG